MDQMIAALNSSAPAVFALMDYWSVDGWLALKSRLSEPDAKPLEKRLFPGIELRLVAPTERRLNAHVLFSDEATPQSISDFIAHLKLGITNRALSRESIIDLARTGVGEDRLKKGGFNRQQVLKNDDVAYHAGASIAEIERESFIEAVRQFPNEQALIFMPWSTSDGLEMIDWVEHYSYVKTCMVVSAIFETRDSDLRGAFVGERTEGNSKWFDSFQATLEGLPRLAVAGSDAHKYKEYGDFPSQKATWIKADPTFLGLMQAIKEPRNRSFIGKQPPKLLEVDTNKTFYIDSICAIRNQSSALTETWLHGCKLPLNPDLVAIIGNKGSGKSALADLIALLGRSRSKEHFSFLTDQRFRSPPLVLAQHFKGTITWKDGTSHSSLLSANPRPEEPELVKYIPQAFFEELCNAHVSGRSNAFENELRSVIFSHTSAEQRNNAFDFSELIDTEERTFRDQIGDLRKELHTLNEDIAAIEAQLTPDRKKELDQLLALKKKEIEEHEKVKPALEQKPTDELSLEQKESAEQIEKLAAEIRALQAEEQTLLAADLVHAGKQRALKQIRERLELLQRQFSQFAKEAATDLSAIGLKAEDIASLTIRAESLNSIDQALLTERTKIGTALSAITVKRKEASVKEEDLKKKLDERQQRYQLSLVARTQWENKAKVLLGSDQDPDSLNGINARIARLSSLPVLLVQQRNKRVELSGQIFGALAKQRATRETLYRPVQELIDSNELIRNDYKLQFKAALSTSSEALSTRLFSLIKQNFGDFRESEGAGEIRRLIELHDLNERTGVIDFVSEVLSKIEKVNENRLGMVGVERALRVNRTSAEVYDLVFGLPYLEPRYTLLFQDTPIEFLSPGQRGALLLIFYLLVDQGHIPIILDQPEENLDNQTVVSLLVPVLNQAKSRRQIFMVTHNPNLAVVCDAEQIVYSSFDRQGQCTIAYVSGSIENPVINKHCIDVLEGTKPAFSNRSRKYH